eukprot:1141830-Pelagomonas_calceolata.AAC.1
MDLSMVFSNTSVAGADSSSGFQAEGCALTGQNQMTSAAGAGSLCGLQASKCALTGPPKCFCFQRPLCCRSWQPALPPSPWMHALYQA